jgi:predicted O-methyltransferase YrrM
VNFREFLKYTAAGRLVLMPARLVVVAGSYASRQLGLMLRWTFSSKEYYNHSYHLTRLNRDYLVSYISVVSGHPLPEIEKYIAEIETDTAFRNTLEQLTLNSPARHSCDVEPRYGRRMGWYALIRATKPSVVVETGVDRGLGTAVIAAALKRNADEGFPGIVYATDIITDCGHLLAEPYKSFCKILIGDSVTLLKEFRQPVDVFLHDSNHDPEYEWAEFLAIEPRLHPASLVMSDNSKPSPKLREFAARRGKTFLYFQDEPKDHWWPGDGIGTAFTLGQTAYFPAIAKSPAGKPAAE